MTWGSLLRASAARPGLREPIGVRLTDEADLFDVAFQVSDGRVLFEAVRSSEAGLGEAFGSVGGLIDGLSGSSGKRLLDAGARRMRALTGYDRVTLTFGKRTAESSRGAFAGKLADTEDLPGDDRRQRGCSGLRLPAPFRRDVGAASLMRSPDSRQLKQLREAGVRSMLSVPIRLDGQPIGQFRCESRKANAPRFELHAAAELFAQLFAQRLEIDRLKGG